MQTMGNSQYSHLKLDTPLSQASLLLAKNEIKLSPSKNTPILFMSRSLPVHSRGKKLGLLTEYDVFHFLKRWKNRITARPGCRAGPPTPLVVHALSSRFKEAILTLPPDFPLESTLELTSKLDWLVLKLVRFFLENKLESAEVILSSANPIPHKASATPSIPKSAELGTFSITRQDLLHYLLYSFAGKPQQALGNPLKAPRKFSRSSER